MTSKEIHTLVLKLVKTDTVKCSHCWWYCQGSQWVSKWLIEKSTSTLQGAAIEKGIGRAWKEYWRSHSTCPCLYYISNTYWLQTLNSTEFRQIFLKNSAIICKIPTRELEKGIGWAKKEYWWSHSTCPCRYYISNTYRSRIFSNKNIN